VGLAGSSLQAAPEQAVARFVAALNAGQLELATACFVRDACLLAPGATAIHGREEVRSLLAQMISSRVRVEIVFSTVLCAGDVAYSRQRWSLSSVVPGGISHSQALESNLILRLLEGRWKIAIAMPWG
jgi:ketosteroid isomerase-like protein